MLFLRPGTTSLIRGQGTFVSDDEINRVVSAIATNDPDYLAEFGRSKAGRGTRDRSCR